MCRLYIKVVSCDASPNPRLLHLPTIIIQNKPKTNNQLLPKNSRQSPLDCEAASGPSNSGEIDKAVSAKLKDSANIHCGEKIRHFAFTCRNIGDQGIKDLELLESVSINWYRRYRGVDCSNDSRYACGYSAYKSKSK